MRKILLVSQSKIKEQALQEFLNETSNNFTLDCIASNNTWCPEQPIEPYGIMCAKLRIQSVEDELDNYNAIYSIESSVDMIECRDYVNIVCNFDGRYYGRARLAPIDIPKKYIEQMQTHNLRLPYGYDTTTGEIIDPKNPKNWMGNRVEQIKKALYTVEPFGTYDPRVAINYIVDFPKKGVVFKDISPLFYRYAKEMFYNTMLYKLSSISIDVVVGIESRGFAIGSVIADRRDASFVMVRKEGKLPPPTIKQSYGTEYSKDTLEISTKSISSNSKVVIVDDLVATGGSLIAAAQLVKKACPTSTVVCCFAPFHVESFWEKTKQRFSEAKINLISL